MITPFLSYWMGGFECSDMINRHGERVDLLRESGHLQNVQADYEKLAEFGIAVVREGIRWSSVETAPYQYDWRKLDQFIAAGKSCGVQQIWDLCHFGMPDDLTPLHPAFLKRFVSLCRAFVRHYRSIDRESILIITPINEVSFFSWLGGEVACTTPFAQGIGWQVKYELTKAYIAGIKALKEEDPGIVILSTEPLVDIVPPLFADAEDIAAAALAHEDQYQVLDMICGRICPELGGNEMLIDIIGCNFYYSNRFSRLPGDIISWINEHHDERFRPLHQLISESFDRYRRPHILAETSHPKEDRPYWLKHIIEECELLTETGIPFWGVCWYPIIDRPDWDDLSYWHQAGLWDKAGDNAVNILHQPLAQVFLENTGSLSERFPDFLDAGVGACLPRQPAGWYLKLSPEDQPQQKEAIRILSLRIIQAMCRLLCLIRRSGTAQTG